MKANPLTRALVLPCLWLVACEPGTKPAGGVEPANGTGLRDVVHLVDHYDDVVALQSPLQGPLIPVPIHWPLSAGRGQDDGLTCHELPWDAVAAAGVTVRQGEVSRTAVMNREAVDAEHFLFVPAVRRILADDIHDAGSDGDGEPQLALRRRRTSVHQASQVLFRDRQRSEVSVELTGEPVTVRVRARPEAAVPGRLELQLDGQKVTEFRFRQPDWEDFSWELGALSGRHLLQCVARPDRPTAEAAKVVCAILWLEVESGRKDRVLLGPGEPEAVAEYAGRLPQPEEVLDCVPGRTGALPVVGGTVEWESTAPISRLRVVSASGEQDVPLPAAGIGVQRLELPAGLAIFDAETAATVRVRQGRAALLPFVLEEGLRLDDDLSPVRHGDRSLEEVGRLVCSRLEVNGDRRAALFLPTPGNLSMRVQWQAGDRLRFAIGRAEEPTQWRPSHAQTPAPGHVDARLLLRFTPDGGAPVELGAWSAPADRWEDIEREVPAACAGAGVLEMVSRSDSAWECVPLAVADPRIVPPRDQLRPRTNLLLYLVDTLRADRLGCYGGTNPTSPRLDRLAQDGFLFENLRAVASWTRPTTATAMTGLYPSYHGIVADDRSLAKDLVTLAEVLRAEGYSTWAGVTNIQVSAPGVQFEQGFHRFATPATFGIHNPQVQIEPSSRLLGTAMRPWLRAHHDEPFFLYLHSMDPHIPYLPPADFKDRFTDGYDGVLADVPLIGVGDLWKRIDQMGERDVEYLRDVYDAEIRCQDDEIGAVADLLAELKELDSTVLAVFSDHGEEFFEHQKFTHAGRMWEELLHVPLVLHLPAPLCRERGLTPGRRIPTPVSQVDLFPGLLDLLGVQSNVVNQGETFVPWMQGAAPDEPRIQYAHENAGLGALVQGDRKLIWRPSAEDPSRTEWLLFDLGTDAGEQSNLAGDAAERLPEMIQWKQALEAGLGKNGALVPHEARGIAFDDATIEQLKALGYLTEDH